MFLAFVAVVLTARMSMNYAGLSSFIDPESNAFGF